MKRLKDRSGGWLHDHVFPELLADGEWIAAETTIPVPLGWRAHGKPAGLGGCPPLFCPVERRCIDARTGEPVTLGQAPDEGDGEGWTFWRQEQWWAGVTATALGLTLGAVLGGLIARQIAKS